MCRASGQPVPDYGLGAGAGRFIFLSHPLAGFARTARNFQGVCRSGPQFDGWGRQAALWAICGCGETGRRTRFRFWRRKAWGFKSLHPHQMDEKDEEMQVTETLKDGLKRAYTITVTAAELDAKVQEKLLEAQPEVEIKGFRKGKVPLAILKKQFGQRLMGDAMQDAIDGAMKLRAGTASPRKVASVISSNISQDGPVSTAGSKNLALLCWNLSSMRVNA